MYFTGSRYQQPSPSYSRALYNRNVTPPEGKKTLKRIRI